MFNYEPGSKDIKLGRKNKLNLKLVYDTKFLVSCKDLLPKYRLFTSSENVVKLYRLNLTVVFNLIIFLNQVDQNKLKYSFNHFIL